MKICVVSLAMLLGPIAMIPAWAACSCGPDFCQDDARIPGALSQKKQSLRASGYPERLVALLDRGDQCYARITRAPDIFTILTVEPNGDKQTVPWDADNERIAKNKLASGQLSRFWTYNARRAFSCCGQPNYDQRPDYDATDDVNTSTALKCSAPGC